MRRRPPGNRARSPQASAPGANNPGLLAKRSPSRAPRPVKVGRPGQAAGTKLTAAIFSPAASAAEEWADELIVAEVVAPHGIRGMVRAVPHTDYPEELEQLEEVILDGPRRQTMRVTRVQPHGRVLLFQFEGIDTMEAAETLRGSQVKIPRTAARPLPPGHFYVSDIIGMEVITEDGRPLGTVREVLRTGSNDVYRTEKAMVPATREAVTELDVEGRRMHVLSALVVEE